MPPWSDPVVLEGADEGSYIDATVMHFNGQELRITQGNNEGSVLLDSEMTFWLLDYITEHFDWDDEDDETTEETD